MRKLAFWACSAVIGSLAACADEVSLVWNGADGAPWEGENWLDGETPSAWVDGANATFNGAATVSLGSAVVVSNLTTEGTLSIGGTATATYEGFVPKDASTLVFPGLTLADITAIQGEMGGKSMSGGSRTFSAFGYHFFPTNGAATVQFQVFQGLIKCVIVEFTDGEGGVYAKAIGTRYVDDGNVKTLGMDLVSGVVGKVVAQGTGNVATSLSTSGYGVSQLRASVARVRLAGEASLGGALATSNTEILVTAPISQTWTQSVTNVNGKLVAKGLSSATADTTYGIVDSSVSGVAAAWLTGTAANHVLTNMVLARMVPVSAVMRGSAIGYNAAALPYHVTFDGETMRCQFQIFASGVKCCLVEFRQAGANVTARAVQAYWWDKAKGGTEDKVGTDIVAERAKPNTQVVNYGITQYGVKSMTLRTVSVPSLTLNAASSCVDMLADNAQMVFAGANAQPTGDLVAKNGAGVVWLATCGNGTGRLRLFESGSTLLPLVNMSTESLATYVFDAAMLYTPMTHWSQGDGCNYFNFLTLRNGARAVGNPLRCGYGGGTSGQMVFPSEGTGPNRLAAGINLVNNRINKGKDDDGNTIYEPNMDSPNHIYLETVTDLEISGCIRDNVDSSNDYSGSGIVKRGNAMLTLSGTNTFAGRLTVEAGTLTLASDEALPSSAPMTLAGGTVSCGAATNATGTLTLVGDATIVLGDGAIAFADSSGATWAEGATLNVVGTDRLPTKSLRFGTTSAGLTSAQTRQITYNGEPVALDSQGYLRHYGGLVISIR